MYDFVQLISAEAGMQSDDFSTEKKHMPSIFLISLTKSGLFSRSKSWSFTYVGYFWATVESSSQINIITTRKERFGKKCYTLETALLLAIFLCGSVVLKAPAWLSTSRFLSRVTDAQLNILQPLPFFSGCHIKLLPLRRAELPPAQHLIGKIGVWEIFSSGISTIKAFLLCFSIQTTYLKAISEAKIQTWHDRSCIEKHLFWEHTWNTILFHLCFLSIGMLSFCAL